MGLVLTMPSSQIFLVILPFQNGVLFFCNVNRPTSLAVYEITWKNIVEPSRPQVTIWRMRIAYWITKATDTHSEYVLLEIFALLACYAS